MADELRQVLGFDASQALDTLKQLDAALGTLEARLQSTASRFANFNKDAGRTVSALIQITRNATAAANALAAVNSAQGGNAAQTITQNANAATQAAQQTASAMQTVAQTTNTAASTVTSATGRMARGIKNNATESVAHVDRLTVSMKLLSRIVFTQAIVRALSTLRNTFRQTAAEAIEFQKRLALVRTIDDSGASLEQLSDAVRGISDAFNIPILEAAEGLYQAISNQVGNTAESLEFLGEAAKFARATNSSLSDSVDLLSGALKSFNLDVDDTDRVASIFFKTIDLGRITADQLSNAFGRVGPAAAEIGIELEEVGAAIAAISVRGSNTAETLTQFRNIITALVKPSVAMKDALRELNFESAEQAIRTEGLDGVLRALAQSTGGSAEAMARLFPNVRGLNGVAALTADNLETLANNINEMSEAGEKFSDAKFLTATETDAERVTQQINRLKNAFTVDLGQALLKTVADFSRVTGGVDNLIGVIQAAGPAIAGVTVSIVALATSLKAASLAGVGLSRSLALLALVPVAQGIGSSIGQFIDAKLFEKTFEQLRKLQEQNAADLGKLQEELEKTADAQKSSDAERIQSVRQATQDISGEFLNQRDIILSANASLVKNTKAAVNDIIQAFERLTEAQAQAAATAREIQDASAERVTALQDRQGQLAFEDRTRQFTDAQKAFALTKRSAELASEAARTLRSAGGDQDQINRGLALFNQAQQAAEQAQSTAQRAGDLGAEVGARNQLKTAITQQIDAEKRLSQEQERRVTELNKVRSSQKDILDLVRQQAKLVVDNTGLFNAEGQQFGDEEQTRRDELRKNALKNLVDLSKQIDPQKLKELGLGDFINQFEQQLTRDPIRLAFTVENETQRIKAEIGQAFQDFSVQLRLETGVDVKELEALVNRTLSTPAAVFGGLDEAAAKANEIRRQINESITGGEEQQNLRTEIDNILNRIDQIRTGRETFTSDVADSARQAFDATVSLLEGISAKSEVTKTDIETAAQAVAAFTEQVRGGNLNERLAFNSSADALDVFVQKLIQIQQLQQQGAAAPNVQQLQQQLQSLDTVQQRIQQSGIGPQLESGGQSLTIGATALLNAVQPSATIRSEAQLAGSALEAGAAAWIQASGVTFNAPTIPGAAKGLIQAFAKGGFTRFFADGGFTPRGVDTIPAMLTQGESVINPKSTRKFFSQLQAINAGQTPIFREAGGSVTNVGDINVTVKSGESGEATARAIASKLRRELRRGTSRI